MNAFASIFIACGIVATGFMALRLLRPGKSWSIETFAVSTALGLSITMGVLYLPVAVTGNVHFTPALVVHGLALLAIARIAWPARRSRLVLGPVTLLAIGASLFYVDVVTSHPYYSYDAKAIYGLKAKALLNEGTLDTPLFQDVDVVHYHPDYPLGLSLVMAYTGFVAEGPPGDPRGTQPATNTQAWVARYDAIDAYMPLTLLWVGAFVCLIAAGAARFGARSLVVVSVLSIPLAVIAPLDIGASWRTTPELPLSLCLGVIALHAFGRGASTRQTLFVAGALAMGSTLLKNDCLLGLLSIAVAVALLGRGRRRRQIPLSLVAGTLVGLLPVLWVRSATAGAPYDEHYLSALFAGDPAAWLARTAALPLAVWEALVSMEAVPYWAFLLLVAIPLAWRAGGRQRGLALAMGLHLALCLAVFVVTPNHMHWHVRTALARLWSQMAAPAGFLITVALAQLLGDVFGSRRPAPTSVRIGLPSLGYQRPSSCPANDSATP
jgi:hypothetical protein